jgi:hypothetical protein
MANRLVECRTLLANPMLLVAVMATTACATSSNAADLMHSMRGRGAVVEVRNDEFDDLIIYLIRGGTPIPLGIAPGLSRRALRVFEGQLGNGGAVVLGAGQRGGPIQRTTAPFDLAPGRIATWTVRAAGAPEQPIVRPPMALTSPFASSSRDQ